MSGFKVVALLKAKSGMSKEALIKFYEEKHVPHILSLFPTITTIAAIIVTLKRLMLSGGRTIRLRHDH